MNKRQQRKQAKRNDKLIKRECTYALWQSDINHIASPITIKQIQKAIDDMHKHVAAKSASVSHRHSREIIECA